VLAIAVDGNILSNDLNKISSVVPQGWTHPTMYHKIFSTNHTELLIYNNNHSAPSVSH